MTGSSLFTPPSNQTIRRQFNPRSLLPLSQHSVWRVEQGIVRTMTWLEDGTAITLGLWGTGDILSLPFSKIDPYQVECLSKVEAVSIPIQDWQGREETLLARTQQAEELLVIRSYRRTDEMLVKLLAWLVKRFGKEVEQGQLIDLRLTHQDIAEILGATRVTITRLLSQFEQQGIIERLPLHRIVVKEAELWYYEI